mmetsp:Transcript_67091/g.108769  ORF Transcript_67091/g.108769 Transcript_67091/m.108769 type:complete len:108 (-) Transcript_67091:317-640(-)
MTQPVISIERSFAIFQMGPEVAEKSGPGAKLEQSFNRGSVKVTFLIAAPTAEIRPPTNQMRLTLSPRATCAVLTQHSLRLPAIPPIALDGWGTRFSSASLDSQVLLP